MAAPNYTGRLLDQFILTVVQQTQNVRENPDDESYATKRSAVLDRVVKALWNRREMLHLELRGVELKKK